jgi:hypothetical protein
MARAGYRIFDADTHIIEPGEPIEEYLTAAERSKLAALGPVVGRSPAKGGSVALRDRQAASAESPARLT